MLVEKRGLIHMTEHHVVNHKLCPKCETVIMKKMPTSGTLPKYIGKSGTPLGDPTPVISQSDVFVAEVYFCPMCRFVELYAD
jgi:hypothetical protein